MILYHGTNCSFDVIDLEKSKPNKDFGRGFYLSADYNQALDMARIKVNQMHCGEPVVLKFEIKDEAMMNLNVLQFDDYSKEWAKFILANRNNLSNKPVHDYDVVIGPIANDKVGVQLWRYENQVIDLETLVEKLRFMKGITIQYFFGTEKAISLLKLLK